MNICKELQEKINTAAKKTVQDVCKVKKGEYVLIVTNRTLKNGIGEAEVISQAIYDQCIAQGAKAVIIVQAEKASMDYADPAVIAAIKTEPDVFFSISENKLGKDEQAIKEPIIANDGSSYDHIFDFLLHGKKTMRAVWTPGITLDMFSRTVDIDYNLLNERCKTLSQLYEGVESVHVTAPAGTDIIVPVADRLSMVDDGAFFYSGTGGNIPAGEVFISPIVGDGKEQGCTGKIVFDGSMTINKGDMIIQTPIDVEVKAGFVTSISGGIEAEKLLETINSAQETALQMEKEGKLPAGQGEIYSRNARNIGELGIGLNPAAKITGNMLEDEKAFRTCHFAIGANYDGDAPSLIHLDCVVKDPTIVFNYADGTSKTVLSNGTLNF